MTINRTMFKATVAASLAAPVAARCPTRPDPVGADAPDRVDRSRHGTRPRQLLRARAHGP